MTDISLNFPVNSQLLRSMANCIRALAMDAVEAAQSGHPGQPMGMADVATVLFTRHLKFYAAQPHWPDRDRFILSGGHGSMLLYALAYLTNYPDMTLDDIRNFRQLGSSTAGHPERHIAAGIEMTTGPLGQGLASSVGFALSERMLNARYGDHLCTHKTYVMCGDGDLQEGVTHEACALAGHLNLNNLIVLYDDNQISIDGSTSLSFTEDVCKRFDAYGWITRRIDGHDIPTIDATIAWAKTQQKPVFIACKTTIGFGAGTKAGTAECHGSPLGADEIATARKNLNWSSPPFIIPDDLLTQWKTAGLQHRDQYLDWEKSLADQTDQIRQNFIEQSSGIPPYPRSITITAAIKQFKNEQPKIATRKASQIVLEHLIPALPQLIGGSADLTGSNLTKIKSMRAIQANDFIGNYIHYGVREHGMGAIMNGIALHGGFIPYGGTFLCFADYVRPAIRLAALMKTPVIYVMTHDSIGLGEDGPTHQPIEHLASLRAIPNVLVLRPADAVETAICWDMALRHQHGPSILCLTRQNLPPLPIDEPSYHGAYQGGYVIKTNAPDPLRPDVVLCATGSEVEIALLTANQLYTENITARVVSIPSFEIFSAQPQAYQASVLGPNTLLKVGIEAGVEQGWGSIIGSEGLFCGLSNFGASGPYQQVYRHFGLTPDIIAETIRQKRRQ